MGFQINSEADEMELTNEYRIACEIYHQNICENQIWFNKLVDIFGDVMEVDVISNIIDELFESKILESSFSKHEDQYKGVVFYIASEFVDDICKYYNEFWKDVREKELKINV